MINLPKVRYAVLVAAIGLAAALIPGLTDTLAEWVRFGSLLVGGLLSVLRIAGEFFDKPTFKDQGDKEFYTMLRGTEAGGFWAAVKRAW